MFSQGWTFKAAGQQWRAQVKADFKQSRFRVLANKAVLAETAVAHDAPDALEQRVLTANTTEGPMEITFGIINSFSWGVQARLNGALVFRSHKQDFQVPEWLRKATQMNAAPDSPEAIAMRQRAKDRMPAIYVDLAMGVLFFLVGREFGLVTAALSGAAVTVALFIVQRFVKWDLLGGLAVFGVVMALISAGLAWAFQDELFVKLRGTVMAGIVAACFLTDAAFGGRYLGVRIAGYLEQMMQLRPARASLAMGLSGLLVAGIDTAAAFALQGDAWLVYNAFLDGFVAFPIILGGLWLAREKSPAAPGPAGA
jgi:intracellular septation protein A